MVRLVYSGIRKAVENHCQWFLRPLATTRVSQPTIVVITDRNDLDDQLYTQFSKCKEFLRQTPIQAYSRENLKELLSGREANGIIFTTMQKFEESDEPLSERRNIIVMTDEAHRGQYGFEEKVDATTGKISIGTARIIHNSLPNASLYWLYWYTYFYQRPRYRRGFLAITLIFMT